MIRSGARFLSTDYASGMLMPAHSCIYLREHEIDYRSKWQSDLVFSMIMIREPC
jgi:hypothetical protein